MARMRAAASSMASGRPSRWRTISTTSSTLSGPSANPGRAAMAHSTKSRAAGASSGDRRSGALVGNRERSHAPHLLAGKSEHLATGGQDGDAGTPAEESLGERRDGASKMLAVVEDQQGASGTQVLDEGLLYG